MKTKNKAASLISAHIKGFLARKKFAEKKRTIKKLVRWLKSRAIRLLFLKKKKAITCI